MTDLQRIASLWEWADGNLDDGLATNSVRVHYDPSGHRVVLEEASIINGFPVFREDLGKALVRLEGRAAFTAFYLDLSIQGGLSDAQWELRDELGALFVDQGTNEARWVPISDLGFDVVTGGYFRISYANSQVELWDRPE